MSPLGPMVKVVANEVTIGPPLVRAQLAFDVAIHVTPESLYDALALVCPPGVRIDVAVVARVGPLEQIGGTPGDAIMDDPLLLGVQPEGAADLARVAPGIAIDPLVHGRGVHRGRRAYDHPLTRTGHAVTVCGTPCT
jgi:hypothetical protein